MGEGTAVVVTTGATIFSVTDCAFTRNIVDGNGSCIIVAARSVHIPAKHFHEQLRVASAQGVPFGLSSCIRSQAVISRAMLPLELHRRPLPPAERLSG